MSEQQGAVQRPSGADQELAALRAELEDLRGQVDAARWAAEQEWRGTVERLAAALSAIVVQAPLEPPRQEVFDDARAFGEALAWQQAAAIARVALRDFRAGALTRSERLSRILADLRQQAPDEGDWTRTLRRLDAAVAAERHRMLTVDPPPLPSAGIAPGDGLVGAVMRVRDRHWDLHLAVEYGINVTVVE